MVMFTMGKGALVDPRVKKGALLYPELARFMCLLHQEQILRPNTYIKVFKLATIRGLLAVGPSTQGMAPHL
jgi:hypothetical protein